MKPRHFFISLVAAGGVLIAFNIFVACTAGSIPRFILRQIKSTPRIDVLFLGNSLIQAGLDPAAFRAGWPDPATAPCAFNAGLTGSWPVEQYILLRQIYREHEPVPLLVYGFIDLELTDRPRGTWDELTGNRAMSYDFEPRTAAALYFPGSTYEQWRFSAISAIPMLRDHGHLWKYVELFRRSLETLGLPPPKTDQFGRIADFKPIALPDRDAFDQTCRDLADQSVPLAPAVQKIFQLAHEKKARVIVVEMPMTATRRSIYYYSPAWLRYRAILQQRLQGEGIRYIAAGDWVADSGFLDGLHLNGTGAMIFSKRLAETIAALGAGPR